MPYGNRRHATQQEGQQETKVVVAVERAYQHGHQDEEEGIPKPGWADMDLGFYLGRLGSRRPQRMVFGSSRCDGFRSHINLSAKQAKPRPLLRGREGLRMLRGREPRGTWPSACRSEIRRHFPPNAGDDRRSRASPSGDLRADRGRGRLNRPMHGRPAAAPGPRAG